MGQTISDSSTNSGNVKDLVSCNSSFNWTIQEECKFNEKFNAPKMAQYILERADDKKYFIKTKDNTIWTYNKDKGIYEDNGEEIIRNAVRVIMNNFFNQHFANEVIGWFKDNIIDIPIYERDELNNKVNYINLRNGVYNINTRLLFPHSPEYLFTTQLPIEYDENAKIDKISKFLEEILQKEDIPIIQELIGYCLYRKYHLHKAFMFIGSGRNGKSTLINLIEALIGKENCCSVSLQDITNNRFSQARLYGKMANLYADLSSKGLRETGKFKMLTGEDRISADIKHKEGFEFDNYAKLVYSCNEIPTAKDDTFAYFSRWIPIQFLNVFVDKNCNPNLLEEIITDEELSGFFNWAMEGLQKLLENKNFTKSISSEEALKEFIRQSSPVRAFIKEHIMENISGSKELKSKVYEKYKEYCNKYDYTPKPSNTFSVELKQYITKIDECRNSDGDKMWMNIMLVK